MYIPDSSWNWIRYWLEQSRAVIQEQTWECVQNRTFGSGFLRNIKRTRTGSSDLQDEWIAQGTLTGSYKEW